MLGDVQSPRRPRLRRSADWWPVVPALPAFCLLLLLGVQAQEKPGRRVLIFYESSPNSPLVRLVDEGIEAALNGSLYRIEFYREYMETASFPEQADQQEFREFYARKYRSRVPDVIIAVGPSPLRFMVETHKRSFPGAPVIYCLPNRIPGGFPVDSDFTGVQGDIAPAKTLDVGRRLRPDTKHVVVVAGTTPFDKQQLAAIQEQLRPYEGSLDISYVTDFIMPDLLDRLRHLPTHTIVLLGALGGDAAGNRFTTDQSGPMVVSAANVPVFSLNDRNLNHGEVGGDVANAVEEGKIAGGMTLRLLNGEKPQDIAPVKDEATLEFDWRALKRWGMKESELPPGSIVVNRQPTVWESYKAYIFGGISLIVAETLLIFGLIWQRKRARRAETQLRESEERFRLVANTAPVMIWTAGTDRKCGYVNKTWLDFTGRPLEAELGDGWGEGVHPDDSNRRLQTYTEAFDRRESFEMQYRVQRKDGEYRWVLDHGVPRFNPDGTFVGYIGSCIDITERKLAEESLATIGRRLIEAHEEERTWIGRELHDDINQRLALLAIELDRWSQDALANEVTELVRHTRARVTEIAQDVQGLSHRLHSSKLDYLGLATAAKSFCREISEKTKVEIEFGHAGIPRSLSKEVSLCLFRVLQEALQNAVKHSGVRSFMVDLRGTEESIELTVADTGSGFEEQEACTRHGLGLISMRERLHLVHGELSVKSQPGTGTTIRARVPLKTDEYRAMAG